LSCACLVVVSLIIGLSVGLSKSETNSSSILVGTTNANVTIDKLGILSLQQGRLVGGCSNLDQIVATTFEDKVYFYTNSTRYFLMFFKKFKAKRLYSFNKCNRIKY